jgi:signal transduction histidine kinase
MRKVALVFLIAVIAPSLVLAWLAVRSLRDQQFLLERQQSLLYQGVADRLAQGVVDQMAEYQRQFQAKAEVFYAEHPASDQVRTFDDWLRREWPMAQVGFVVTAAGDIIAPAASPELTSAKPKPADRQQGKQSAVPPPAVSPSEAPANVPATDSLRKSQAEAVASQRADQTEAAKFLANNGLFLANQQPAEVYFNNRALANSAANDSPTPSPLSQTISRQDRPLDTLADSANNSGQQARKVIPQQHQQWASQQILAPQPNAVSQKALESARATKDQSAFPATEAQAQKPRSGESPQAPLSRLVPSEAPFRQLIREDANGNLARFVDNELNVLFWHRPSLTSPLIFGAQISLSRLRQEVQPLALGLDSAIRDYVCLALLDDSTRLVASSHPGFQANWKRPFVATEIGEILPHWEAAVYLLDPGGLARAAQTVRWTLGLLVIVLVLAISIGSWLIVADLRRQLALARQKTDFVSNVSHELKTPLTSIRMFSELLAEGRVSDPQKQKSYLGIITSEAARLTRLINNVLDFARLERGEKKYHFQAIDLAELVRETAESYRPHLEANGFRLDLRLPDEPILVQGDRDGLAQVIVNLLSNAEKYGGERKEIAIELAQADDAPPSVQMFVHDRGDGVPPGAEEKIFEQFYRAHDSLSSGVQGSGLGLTLARQIARAHQGDVLYSRRPGGGSSFALRLPKTRSEAAITKPTM